MVQYDGKGQAGSVISRIMGSRADLRQHGKHVAPLVAKKVAKANSLAQSEGLEAIRVILENELRIYSSAKSRLAEGLA